MAKLSSNRLQQGRNQMVFSGEGNDCNALWYYFRGGARWVKLSVVLLYLTTKHVFEYSSEGSIARLSPLVAGLACDVIFYATPYEYSVRGFDIFPSSSSMKRWLIFENWKRRRQQDGSIRFWKLFSCFRAKLVCLSYFLTIGLISTMSMHR